MKFFQFEFFPQIILVFFGVAMIFNGVLSFIKIKNTLNKNFQKVKMEVIEVNLIPNSQMIDSISTPLLDKTSMVLVKYRYYYNQEKFESREIFPHHIEYMKPRISAFDLYEKLKSCRISHCYVNVLHPNNSLLFIGFTPYLKKHIAGVSVAGFFTSLLGMFFWIFYA